MAFDLNTIMADPTGYGLDTPAGGTIDYTQFLPGYDAGANSSFNTGGFNTQPASSGSFDSFNTGFNFDPTSSGSAWDSRSLDTLDPAAKQKLFNDNLNQPENGVWDNIQGFLKQNSGEIFAKAFLGAGTGVLGYLAERRKARDLAAMKAQENQFIAGQRNADIARASAVPVVGSMINPNAPRNVGLLGQVKRA